MPSFASVVFASRWPTALRRPLRAAHVSTMQPGILVADVDTHTHAHTHTRAHSDPYRSMICGICYVVELWRSIGSLSNEYPANVLFCCDVMLNFRRSAGSQCPNSWKWAQPTRSSPLGDHSCYSLNSDQPSLCLPSIPPYICLAIYANRDSAISQSHSSCDHAGCRLGSHQASCFVVSARASWYHVAYACRWRHMLSHGSRCEHMLGYGSICQHACICQHIPAYVGIW